MNLFEELLKKDEKEILMMSPLTWAYVGDSVYEMYVRSYLSNTTNLNPHRMHVQAIKFVKAAAQANIVSKLDLNEAEQDIVRRGRNTQNHHLPKNASHADYSYATGFESLIGYLFLTKQEERLKIILDNAIEIVVNEK